VRDALLQLGAVGQAQCARRDRGWRKGKSTICGACYLLGLDGSREAEGSRISSSVAAALGGACRSATRTGPAARRGPRSACPAGRGNESLVVLAPGTGRLSMPRSTAGSRRRIIVGGVRWETERVDSLAPSPAGRTISNPAKACLLPLPTSPRSTLTMPSPGGDRGKAGVFQGRRAAIGAGERKETRCGGVVFFER